MRAGGIFARKTSGFVRGSANLRKRFRKPWPRFTPLSRGESIGEPRWMNIDTKFDDGPNSKSEDRPIFHSKESWRNESEFFFFFRRKGR